MKLRIKGASIRMRLTQGEMDALASSGVVEEHVPFAGNATLIYRLRQDAGVDQINATYTGNVVEVRIPERAAREWCSTDQVGIHHSLPVNDGELRIALEKDFACLAPRAEEDESDNFPHPQTGKSQC